MREKSIRKRERGWEKEGDIETDGGRGEREGKEEKREDRRIGTKSGEKRGAADQLESLFPLLHWKWAH